MDTSGDIWLLLVLVQLKSNIRFMCSKVAYLETIRDGFDPRKILAILIFFRLSKNRSPKEFQSTKPGSPLEYSRVVAQLTWSGTRGE